MTKKVRSAKGVIIDFDVEQIKGQIASSPAPSTVKARQDFIDQKYRRRKKISEQISQLEASSVDRKLAETPAIENKKIDEVVEEPAPKKRTIKRKTKTENNKEE